MISSFASNTLKYSFSVLLLVGYINANSLHAEFTETDSSNIESILSDTSQIRDDLNLLGNNIYNYFQSDLSSFNSYLQMIHADLVTLSMDSNQLKNTTENIEFYTESINSKLSDINSKLSSLDTYIINSSGYYESINNSIGSINDLLSNLDLDNSDVLEELQQFHADMNYVLDVEYGTVSELFGELMYGYGADSDRAGSILGLHNLVLEFHTDFLDLFQIWYDYATRSNEIYNLPDVLNEVSTIPLLNALSNLTAGADMGIVTNIYEVSTNLQYLATVQTNLTFDILQTLITNQTELTNPISESEADSRSSFSLETASNDFNRTLSTNDAKIVFKEAPDFSEYTNVTYLSESIKSSPQYQEVTSNSSNLISKVEDFYDQSVHYLDVHLKRNDLITRQWSTTVTLVPKNAISSIPDGISWDMSKLKLNPYITTYLGRLWDFLGMILDLMSIFYVGLFVAKKGFLD